MTGQGKINLLLYLLGSPSSILFFPFTQSFGGTKKVLKAAGLLGDGGGVTLAPLGKPAAISHDSKWREK